MRTAVRLGSSLAAAAALVGAGAAPAAAAAEPLEVTLVCGDATYEVVVPPGDGRWSPARVTRTGQVLLPLSFGETTGTLLDASGEPLLGDDGQPVVAFTEPAATKGKGRTPFPTTSCTFSLVFPADETITQLEPDAAFVSVTGSVVVALTPSGR